MNERLPPYLRLVESGSGFENVGRSQRGDYTQHMLFSLPKSNALFFVDVAYFIVGAFDEFIDFSRPRWIFDMRVAPRFDNIAASRAAAFQIFESYAIEYIDLLGALRIRAHQSADLNLHFISQSINQTLEMQEKTKRRGPYVFLFDKKDYLQIAADCLPGALRPKPRDGFEIKRLELHG